MPKSTGEIVKTYLVTNWDGTLATLSEYGASNQADFSFCKALVNNHVKECGPLVCAAAVHSGCQVRCSINYLNIFLKAEGLGISCWNIPKFLD